MKILTALVAFAMTASVAGTALAHKDHAQFDEIKPVAPHFKLELANKSGIPTVYVKSGGENFSTAGATGTLTVLANKVKIVLPLQPSGNNAMVTKDKVQLVSGTRATASIAFTDNTTAVEELMVP